ncbi:MAG: hypothetical protein AB1634_10840 [Thermodesulfobacteriota bacterium]
MMRRDAFLAYRAAGQGGVAPGRGRRPGPWLAAGLALACCLTLGSATGTGSDTPAADPAAAGVQAARSLEERERALADREAALAERERQLASLQEEIDGKLGQLATLQGEIQARLDELFTVQDSRFRNLIKIYSAMSPAKLAPILSELPDDTVAEIFLAMKTDQVVKVLPRLEKAKAVAVSRLLGLLDPAPTEETAQP